MDRQGDEGSLMTATKLGVWNGALRELGHRKLADTGEPVVAGRELTAAYPDVVAECIEEASWNFAMETVQLDADTGVEPAFGFTEVFAKPADWVRTVGISQDEYFNYPLINYYDDASFLSADNTPIYLRYVSNDTGLGLELSRWPAKFRRYVELELAARIAYKITQSETVEKKVEKRRDRVRINAKNTDAMNEPQPKFPPPGSWTQSRSGRMGRGDRGRTGSLTG